LFLNIKYYYLQSIGYIYIYISKIHFLFLIIFAIFLFKIALAGPKELKKALINEIITIIKKLFQGNSKGIGILLSKVL